MLESMKMESWRSPLLPGQNKEKIWIELTGMNKMVGRGEARHWQISKYAKETLPNKSKRNQSTLKEKNIACQKTIQPPLLKKT